MDNQLAHVSDTREKAPGCQAAHQAIGKTYRYPGRSRLLYHTRAHGSEGLPSHPKYSAPFHYTMPCSLIHPCSKWQDPCTMANLNDVRETIPANQGQRLFVSIQFVAVRTTFGRNQVSNWLARTTRSFSKTGLKKQASEGYHSVSIVIPLSLPLNVLENENLWLMPLCIVRGQFLYSGVVAHRARRASWCQPVQATELQLLGCFASGFAVLLARRQ